MCKVLPVILIVICLGANCASYDLIFNTDKDVGQWKFNGSYLYGQKIDSIGFALPNSAVNAVLQEEVPRQGLWLIRYNGPEAENYLRLHYALKHHLFKQALVTFVGTPNVPVTISTNDEELGKFWSDGRQWCDAIVTVNLKKDAFVDIQTSNPGDYVLIDKIVLGVMSNLTQITERRINPCRTTPPTGEIQEDDRAPDMMYKPTPSRRQFAEPPPPDMAVKPTSSSSRQTQNTFQPPPDMIDKSNREPQLVTNTVTTDEANNNNNDSSEVKCGCSCSCSRVKNKKSTLMSMTG